MSNPTQLRLLQLKKGEDKRIRAGYPWIYSNEINNKVTPLKSFTAGEEVALVANNGTILGVGYVNPHSLIAARVLCFGSNQPITKDFFLNRLAQAQHLRDTLFSAPFYRFIFSEGDGIPGLIIDRYHDDFVLQSNTAGIEKLNPFILDALINHFQNIRSILLRNESHIREQEGLERYTRNLYGETPDQIELIENNVRFIVPLRQGQKTGWFYDQRYNRQRLQAYSPQCKVLDVFSYLGGFGLQAAFAGASQVTCIDSSANACDYILENARLNKLSDKVSVHCGDAFDILKTLLKQKAQYDIVVLDPPAFIKKAKDMKAGLIAYLRLNEYALKLLSPNGILVSCSCSMHLKRETLQNIIQRAAFNTQCHLQLLECGHQSPDHPILPQLPETDYLKAVFLRKITL